MANICIQVCESMYLLPSRLLCFILMLLQGGILDYYIVTYKNLYWYGWIAADVAIAFVVLVAFMISYRHLNLVRTASDENTIIEPGSLPLGYFTWIIYSTALAARVGIIFDDFAWRLNEEDFFGPNTLKITISLAGAIFLLLLMSHHDATPNSERKHYIEEITATVVFDILDSVDCLDILFDKGDIDDLPHGMKEAIICISCVNLILPALPLSTLSRSHFGHKSRSKTLSLVHKLSLVFLVNLPLLIFRLLIWHVLSKEISIFPVKNVIIICLVFHNLYEKEREKVRRQNAGVDYVDGHEMKSLSLYQDDKGNSGIMGL